MKILTAAALTLILASPAMAADGDVDGRDFLIWQRNVATPSAQGASQGDLATWQSNFGAIRH